MYVRFYKNPQKIIIHTNILIVGLVWLYNTVPAWAPQSGVATEKLFEYL